MASEAGYCPTPVRRQNKKKLALDAKPSKPKRAAWKQQKVVEESKEEDEEDTMEQYERTKKAQHEDWAMLKQTLRSGDDGSNSPKTVNLQEKAEDIMEMRDDLIQKHMKYIRKIALLLKQEGELITRVQGIDNGGEDYPIDKYVGKMRDIVQYNLKIYSDLDKDLGQLQ